MSKHLWEGSTTFLDGSCQWDRGRCPNGATSRWGLCVDHLQALAREMYMSADALERWAGA